MAGEPFEGGYFENIYDNVYDKRNPSYKFKAYLSVVKRFAKKGSSLLDIGCAYGSFLKQAQSIFKVTGVDISQHAVDIAKSRLPNLTIYQSQLQDINPSTQYDVVTCFDVIEHIDGIENVLAHLKKLLKDKDSIVIVTVPVYDTLVGKLVMKLDKDPTHVHKNSRYWWIKQFKNAGFDVLSWKGIWRYFFFGRFYLHYQTRLTRSFSPAMMIVGRMKKN